MIRRRATAAGRMPGHRAVDSSSHARYEPRMKTHIHLLATALLFSLARFVVAADATGDTIAMSPPFIIEKRQIDQLFDTVRDILKTLP